MKILQQKMKILPLKMKILPLKTAEVEEAAAERARL